MLQIQYYNKGLSKNTNRTNNKKLQYKIYKINQ